MPGYKAIVVGENFEFIVDEIRQQLEFTRDVYVNADDESAAGQAALALVREELLAQSMLDDSSNQLITIDHISQTDVLVAESGAGNIIWHFPDEELFDDE